MEQMSREDIEMYLYEERHRARTPENSLRFIRYDFMWVFIR